MKPTDETIGDRIRKLRLHNKYNSAESSMWNISEFASRCGVSTSALSQIERNVIKNPSSDIVSKVAKEFKIPIEYLLYGEMPISEEKRKNILPQFKKDINSFIDSFKDIDLGKLNKLSDTKKKLYAKFLLSLYMLDDEKLIQLTEGYLDNLITILSGSSPEAKKIVVENPETKTEKTYNPFRLADTDVIL